MNSDPRLEVAALDAMRELIAVLDLQGTIVLVNRAWRDAALKNQAPAPIVAGTGLNYLHVCLQAAEEGDLSARRCHTGLLAVLQGAQPEFELEYSCHSPTEERWFLLRALPLGRGGRGLLLLHSEVTERERLERALRGANRALKIRSECSRVLLQATEEAEALRRMCQVIVDAGGYRFAWVGFVTQEGAIRPAAQAGWSEGYLDFLAVALSAGKLGHGPAATAIRNGKPSVARDIQTDPKFAAWRAEALARGYGSSVALPFSVGGVAGALSLCAAEAAAFGAEEVELLQELANDLSIGVAGLRARAERDRAEIALRQSEEKFVKVFRSLPDLGAISRLADGTILDVSDGFVASTGYAREEMLGRTTLDLGLWRMPAQRAQVVAALRTAGEIHGIEVEYCLRDGSTSLGLMSAKTMTVDGEPCMLSILHDIADRKHAEDALLRSERRLQAIVSNLPLILFGLDADGVFTLSEGRGLQALGLQPGEVVGRSALEMYRDYPDIVQSLRQGLDGSVSRSVHRLGDLTFDVLYMPVTEDRGVVTELIGVAVDISERMRAAEAVEHSEENLRVTLRSIGDGVIATDGEGRVTMMNPVAQALTGWLEAEARGRPLADVFRIVSEETRAEVESPVKRVLAEGTVVGLANHTLLIDRHGVERPIADSGAPIRRSPDGPIGGVVLVFSDQSHDRQVRQRLEEQEAKYRSLVEQVPAVIYVAALDEGSSSLYVSSRVEDMLGFTVQEYEADPELWLRSIHPDDREAVRARLELTQTTGQAFAAEYRLLDKHGREHWISDRAVIVHDSAGNPAFLQGLMFDITDRKHAEQEVARLNDHLEQRVEERTTDLAAAVRELESFSYSVSHDLRAPLRAINGYSSLLSESDGEALGDEGKSLLQRVIANTLKMEQLIDDILHYSRAGRQPFEPGEVRLDDLVRTVARELSEGYPNVKLVTHPLPPVNGDQTMLRQIFANLIGNALKFSAGREHPRIEIGSFDRDGQTVFYVKDNGVGFDMQYAAKLFSMFQRMHTGTEFPGSGVGLAVVKRLVERHRGRIWAQAEPDCGATFCFTLGHV